jgi:hypothetical protein
MAATIKWLNRGLRFFRPAQLNRLNWIGNQTTSKRSYHIDDTLTGISDEQRQV